MNDLNTILRLNAETWAPVIEEARAAGLYVLAVYEGVTLVRVETFPDAEAARLTAEQLTDYGQRAQLYPPLDLFAGPAGEAFRPNDEQRALTAARKALLATKPERFQFKVRVALYLHTAATFMAGDVGEQNAAADAGRALGDIIVLSGDSTEELREWAEAQDFVSKLVADSLALED